MDLLAYFNPYSNQSMDGFLIVLLKRAWSAIQGNLGMQDLASDEIQVLVLTGVALSSALVGAFLVLRRMTMLANALSHTILFGIVLAFLVTRQLFAISHDQYGIDMESMMIASVAAGLLTAFLTEFLNKTLHLQEDASIGLVFTTLFALGIVLVTIFTRNSHVGTEVVMGNVDSLQVEDLGLVWTIVGVNLCLIVLFFKEYQLTTFDASLAKSIGISVLFFNYLLMIQVSATAIGAFRAVGVLMVLAFMVGPVLTARLLTDLLKRMLVLSVLVGMAASILGVALSRHILSVYNISLSTAGVVVCVIVFFYLLALLFSPKQGVFVRLIKQRLQKASL